MHFSRHNIFSKLKDSEDYFIVNILTGNADVLDPEEGMRVENGIFSDRQQYIDKGYLIEEEKEEKLYKKAYLDFVDTLSESEIQIFYVPDYSCNFSCSYCYQGEYTTSVPDGAGEKEQEEGLNTIEAFFSYIDREFAGRNKYITIFGGEPLMHGKTAVGRIEKLITGAAQRGLDVAVVTNGYNLEEYLPLFEKGNIREIQVTLDGPESIHDKRRPLVSGGNSFTKIVSGIDAALAAGHRINLRVVLDRDNISYLPSLAQFAIDRGWTESANFKTQLGRNYELHTCRGGRGELLTRTEIYSELYELLLKHPEITQFHKPAFSVSRFLFENGELPNPLFDSCPGCKTEWAFDYTGKIYSCTATVGKEGEELGTFYPEVSLNREKVAGWENRSVLSIPECRDCSLQLACGGGCASVAKNRTGKLASPDCRPVKELLEMGISIYSKMEDI